MVGFGVVRSLQIGLVWCLQIGLVYCLQIGLAGKLRGLLVIEGFVSHCKSACKCQTAKLVVRENLKQQEKTLENRSPWD